MKYKVGDKVRIREDLVEKQYDGDICFVPSMAQYKGKVATITDILMNSHHHHIQTVGMMTMNLLEWVLKKNLNENPIACHGLTGKKSL